MMQIFVVECEQSSKICWKIVGPVAVHFRVSIFSLFQGFDPLSNLHAIANGVLLQTAEHTLFLSIN